ncbi:MAG TPA: UvrD-helicase domain-containing protein, partial [Holophaga sp.]|nr:UvrD-helicase domain-containing protein [Holophaga sp.]
AAIAEELPDPAEAGSPWLGGGVRFVLSGEISTIYRRDGKTRKVHHVVILPDFAAAARFQARLERVGGNIRSDGRPILGMDSRDLFSLLLEADERAILVPAHIWTPWFSALGARSGFDSIDECYGDLAPRIGAIETGLSSNPPMNWAVGALDRFAIVSNSDAHSPDKLGREATILEAEPSFAGLFAALSRAGGGSAGRVAGTVEFFPQEGKYHYDGHRDCGVVFSPEESAARGGLCPVCGKPLTPGVMRRVAELADRPVDETASWPAPGEVAPVNRQPYRSLVPLPELLGELLGTGPGSKKVAAAYNALIGREGSEFSLLMDRSIEELGVMDCPGVPGTLLAEAVGRMRAGRVSIRPGFDGEYGVIKVFAPGERIEARPGNDLFGGETASDASRHATGDGASSATDDGVSRAPKAKPTKGARGAARAANSGRTGPEAARAPEGPRTLTLDPAQTAAVEHGEGPALVVAGPGTGKTAVLAARIARAVDRGLDPASILAVTFTNKAADELRRRIASTIGGGRASTLLAATFHAFCLSVLREHGTEAGLPPDFDLLDEDRRAVFLAEAAASDAPSKRDSRSGRGTQGERGPRAGRLGSYIEGRKRFLLLPGEESPRLGPSAPEGLAVLAAEFGIPPLEPDLDAAYARYRGALRDAGALDFDDLAAVTVRLLSARPALLSALRSRIKAVFVDEYQDVNFAQYALVRLLAPGGQAAQTVETTRTERAVTAGQGAANQAFAAETGPE